MLVVCFVLIVMLGVGVVAKSAAADMRCPAWQQPHCGTSISCHAFVPGTPLHASPDRSVRIDARHGYPRLRSSMKRLETRGVFTAGPGEIPFLHAG